MINHADSVDRARALRDFDDLVNMIKARFGTTFHEILPFKIAASPATNILPYAFGSDELLKFWVESVPMPVSSLLTDTTSARAMGRFGISDEEVEA